MRTIAEVAGYAYSLTDSGVWVNLYGSNVLDTNLPDGSRLKLIQETNYPWDGTIRFTFAEVPTTAMSVFLRIPGWSSEANVRVNGVSLNRATQAEQYYEVKRTWAKDDRIELTLPMTAQLLEAHPLVEETRNQVAVKRGPLIYCLESLDLPDSVDITDIALTPTTKFNARFVPDLLGGISVLKGKALRLPAGKWDGTLYRNISSKTPQIIDVTFIPYYTWGNRGHSEMTVWLPVR